MALNKLQQMDKEQLIKVIKDSGYIDIAKILMKQDIDGNMFLNIREFDILNWKCSPLMTKKMINFLKEFKQNPSILQLFSVGHSLDNISRIKPSKKPPAAPRRKESPLVHERPSSMPNDNMDFLIKNNNLSLPTNDRAIKSLNDLRQNKQIPKFSYHEVGSSDDFSSDDEDLRTYVNVPKINYVNDTDDPENIYGNLEPLRKSSKPKLSNNISPTSVTDELRSIFKDRQNLIDGSVRVQEQFSSSSSGCGLYDYPRPNVSNIDMEQQKGSILNESLYGNVLGDSISKNVDSDEPIYENTDDIFGKDKSFDARHHTNSVIHVTKERKPYNFDDELYFKSIDRNEAKEFLKNQPDGSFIFRPGDGFVILTVKYRNKIYNLLVEQTDRQTIVLNADIENGLTNAPEFKNLTDLANYYMEKPIIFEDGHIIVNIKLKPVVDSKQKNKSYTGGPTQSSLHSSILSDELAAKLSEALKLKISKLSNIENKVQGPKSTANFNRTPPPGGRDIKASRNQYEYARISSAQDVVSYENLEKFRRPKEKNRDSGASNLNSEQFYRNTDRKGAKLLLENLPDRAFLIRPSDRYFLVLTIKYEGKIYNLGIDQTPEKKLRLDSDGGKFSLEFDSLTDLVNHFTQETISFMHEGQCLEIRLNPVLPSNLF